MPQCELTFRCPLPAGLHARPASLLAEVAGRCASEITLAAGEGGAGVNAKSVLSLVASDIKFGQACRFVIDGSDAEASRRLLDDFVRDVLPFCDDVPAGGPEVSGAGALPRALRDLNLRCLTGTIIAPGVAHGPVTVLADAVPPAEILSEASRGPGIECRRARGAIDSLCADIDDRLRVVDSRSLEAGVLRAHRSIASDVELHKAIDARTSVGEPAGRAIIAAASAFIARLRTADSLYIRERIVDVEDIVQQLLARLYGEAAAPPRIALTQPSLVVARLLTPQQLLGADRAFLLGLVVELVGATSHVAILARSMGVPMLTDIEGARAHMSVAGDAIIDADRGIVIIDPPVVARRCYARAAECVARRRARDAVVAEKPGITLDGRRIDVAANVSSGAEARLAFEQGADAIGLFRTEMLFLDRAAPPSEDEQLAEYRAAIVAARGRPVIIRTFDLGADKTASFLGVAGEDNPALGVRGLRLYERSADLLDVQLRALLRAAEAGPVWIMAPMVATVEEARWFRAQVDRQRTSLAMAADREVRVGVMIEVPSLATQIESLCRVVDFLSIGTNDLSQYFFAADRGNKAVAGLLRERQPAFLRLLELIVDAARRQGRWIGMCGEMAGDVVNLPLLVGLGLDEISLAAPRVAAAKSRLAELDSGACQTLLARALVTESLADVDTMTRGFEQRGVAPPLFDESLVMLDVDAAGQAETIQMLVGALFACGRTDRPQEVEEAVWAREATYSTHFGQGVAVPHCKTPFVRHASIAVARFVAPVAWAPSTEPEVRCAILLAVSEGEAATAHMRVLAALARKLMHEAFRETLLTAPTAAALVTFLRGELGLGA